MSGGILRYGYINNKKTQIIMTSSSDPNQWLDQHGDALYRYALVRVRDQALAEDLVQETLLAAIRSLDNFAQRSSERTWLTGILKHKIIDTLRKASREIPLDSSMDLNRDLSENYFGQADQWQVELDSWAEPERSLEREQFWRVLNECVDGLPERMARVFVLREVEGMSSEEICKVMNISTTNNLWVMLSRIRMRMRQCLELRWFNRQLKGDNEC